MPTMLTSAQKRRRTCVVCCMIWGSLWLSSKSERCARLRGATQTGRPLTLDTTDIIPRLSVFLILGTKVTREETAANAVADMMGTAWSVSFAHRPLVCNKKLHLRLRYKVCRSVLMATCIWGLEAFSLTLRQRSSLSVAHLGLASRMLKLNRSRAPTWIE